MTHWQTPAFELINMNAEIGAYQEDFEDDREPNEPVLGELTRSVLLQDETFGTHAPGADVPA